MADRDAERRRRIDARREMEPRCRKCGYSLLGLEGSKCPECGASVTVEDKRLRVPGPGDEGYGTTREERNRKAKLTVAAMFAAGAACAAFMVHVAPPQSTTYFRSMLWGAAALVMFANGGWMGVQLWNRMKEEEGQD